MRYSVFILFQYSVSIYVHSTPMQLASIQWCVLNLLLHNFYGVACSGCDCGSSVAFPNNFVQKRPTPAGSCGFASLVPMLYLIPSYGAEYQLVKTISFCYFEYKLFIPKDRYKAQHKNIFGKVLLLQKKNWRILNMRKLRWSVQKPCNKIYI